MQESRLPNPITELNCGDGIIVKGSAELMEATAPLIYPLGTYKETIFEPWTVIATRDCAEARAIMGQHGTDTWDTQESAEHGFLNAYSPSAHIYVVAGNDTEIGTLRAVRALKLMKAFEGSDSMAILHSSSGMLEGSGFVFSSDGSDELGSGAGKTSALFAMLTSVTQALYHSNDMTALAMREQGSPISPYIPEVLPLNQQMLEGLEMGCEHLHWDQTAEKYYGYPSDLAEMDGRIGVATKGLNVNNIFFVDLKPNDDETIVKQIYSDKALERFVRSVSLNRTKQASRENPLDPESNRMDEAQSIHCAERIFDRLHKNGVSFWVLEGSVYPDSIRNALSCFVDV